jgi:carboxylesterase type B
MLVGNLDHEGFIIPGAGYMLANWASSQWNQYALVGRAAKQLLNFLSDNDGAAIEGLRWILSFIEDGVFNCPAGEAAAARASAGVPVWRYRFMGQWQNVQIGGKGAYHVSDIPLTMGTTERKTTATRNTAAEEELIKNVMTAWSTFAKDPVNGLTKLGWPRYDPKGRLECLHVYDNSSDS